MTTLALYFFALAQYGSAKKMGLPKIVGQTTVSSVFVASVHCAALIVPAGECTAKCALSHTSGSFVVEPGSVHVPAAQVVAGAVGQVVAQVVLVVPGSQVPLPALPPPAVPAPAAPPLDAPALDAPPFAVPPLAAPALEAPVPPFDAPPSEPATPETPAFPAGIPVTHALATQAAPALPLAPDDAPVSSEPL